MTLLVSIFLWTTLIHGINSTPYYVNGDKGSDSSNGLGTETTAFKTIQKCVDVVRKGDECLVRKGRYHEVVKISGKKGTSTKPIVIQGYKDERPVLDGTIPLKLSWSKLDPSDPDNGIYVATLPKDKKDVYQLFVEDKMMTNARWPDALWKDFSVFDWKYWAKSAKSSGRGYIVDAANDLNKLSFSVKGAMAILNIGSFNTFVAEVTAHTKGSNRFDYDDHFGKLFHFKPDKNIYFLEDKLEFLNQPTEWFYDKTTRKLYLWAADGKNPGTTKKNVRGKVLDYAMEVTDSEYVEIKKLNFFGAALNAYSKTKTNKIDQLTFDSLNFKYPAYSRRMLQDPSPPKWIKIMANYGKWSRKTRTTFKFINNVVYGADGAAIEYSGININIMNNLFERNDWTGAMSQTNNGGLATIISYGMGDRFIRNTMAYNGATAGYKPWHTPRVELNHIYGQCWGLIQNDGAALQFQRKAQENGVVTKNWIHSSPKCGIRFDDAYPPKMGYDGEVTDNVVWETRGIVIKGDRQTVKNNIAWEKTFDRYTGPNGAMCSICVLKHVGKDTTLLNSHSVTTNNGADELNGGKQSGNILPIPGTVAHNVEGDVSNQMVDIDNRDFRPKTGSKYDNEKVGPYCVLKKTKLDYYWIPGHQVEEASQPIPQNGAKVAVGRDSIIWLGGYKAIKHHVYVTAKTLVSGMGYVTTLDANKNIYYFSSGYLKKGSTYSWRIDAVMSSGKVVKGEVWKFTVY